MTPERWEQVKALFQTALERDPPTRSAFLAAACGGDAELQMEVESLLASHERSGSFIETPAASLAQTEPAGPATPTLGPGARLGPYEVSSLLGAGGMAEVYRARDSRLGREVAVKVLTARASRQPFDAVVDDVFEVQATIARQVAQALDVALGQSDRGGDVRKIRHGHVGLL